MDVVTLFIVEYVFVSSAEIENLPLCMVVEFSKDYCQAIQGKGKSKQGMI